MDNETLTRVIAPVLDNREASKINLVWKISSTIQNLVAESKDCIYILPEHTLDHRCLLLIKHFVFKSDANIL
jgi:hypothetical protein